MSHANDDSAVGMTTMTTTTMTTMSKEEKAKDRHVYNNEITPLLTTTMSSASTKERARAAPPKPVVDHNNFVVVAAALLQDYEANRPPAFSSELSDITETQILLHSVKFSGPFSLLLTVATLALFVSSGFESFADSIESRIILTALNFFSLTVFGVDMWIRNEFRSSHYHYSHRHPSRPVSRGRSSRSERLIKPLMLFSIVLGLENLARLLVTRNSSLVLFSSFFKPLVLFYASSQARDALEALRRIIRIVVRVLVIELLLILMFAAVACRLFSDYDRFQDLSTSWLSLFELATTVVNPSIWMPMYEANKFSAFFFIFFIVTAVFYLHSLVLSVVFSSYIQAASEIYERSSADREDAVQLAYLALQEQQQQKTKGQSFAQEDKLNVVDISLVGETLRLVRPHYSAMKINALLEIVDPTNHKYVNYPTFRTKIRQALNASIRTARCASTLAMSIELVAVAVAVVNFCYVILVSSSLDYEWFNSAQERVGVAITLVAGFELAIRFNPLRIPDFTPLTRLNATFDGLALAAALASSIGIIMYAAGRPLALEYILMGRAIDMMRIMRFFEIFRDVVRRSADVLPALTGPIILVATTLHIFVYLGMALWGGAIHVGSHQGEITYLYDLNNFNSYQEGVVTMFQVLVVNDWHAIAEVFLYADRFSSPYIVYPFFIIGNLIGVSIMLNVLTAFFVESFVTKLDDGGADGSAEATTTVQKGRGFSILTSENASVRLVSSSSNMLGTKKTKTKIQQKPNDNGSDGDDADSEASSESEFFQFDVYEREGIDKIMQTIGGSPQSGGDFARHICNYLEIFERLSPGRETVGYLVCDQQTLERFGNRRFQTKAIGFLDENQLHLVVSDMHSELMALSSRPSFDGRSLIRTFPRQGDPSKTLEISASILRRHPALSLFVSRLRSSDGERVDQALSV
jgi:two pore calcium channel protein